jgi:acetoin utilization deacetylase AcuC-like enzyme
VRRIADRLSASGRRFIEPRPCAEEDLLRVHSAGMVESVRKGSFADPDTPALPEMFGRALLAAGAAVDAMRGAAAGVPAFSLMRPPGHHATRDDPMGFCYFNGMALAAASFLGENPGKRIAVLDIDVHHGNGTEDILSGRDRALYVSLHQSPLYPGTGLASRGNCLNHPLPPFSDGARYLAALDEACAEIRAFAPDLVGLSAGFDAHEADPLAQLRLAVSDYGEIGRRVAALAAPVFVVMEGGYGEALPDCVEALMDGLAGLKPRI